MRTGLVTHPGMLLHDTGPGHPERPARAAAITDRLRASGLAAHLEEAEAPECDPAEIAAVHGPDHVARVRSATSRPRAVLDGGDTAVCAASWRASHLAAGGAVLAADRVLDGVWANAFVVCRPPGHHAERDTPMGFCLFNNVAVAASHLRRRSVPRVAIVDFDVHHGNGTQDIFWADGSVFYASLHQFPWYPGTGAPHERGEGDGDGANLNCPMPSGSGDREWLATFERTVMPALEDFDPAFVLISAGFDAHADDPLSGTRVTEAGFRGMTELLTDLARRRCGGRIVSLLEGGYDLGVLAASAETHVGVLVGAAGSGAAGLSARS